MSALALTSGDVPTTLPGALGNGVTLLPNGWKIAPAGHHVQVGSFPLAMAQSVDGRDLYIASNGYLKPAITVVDIASHREPATVPSTSCDERPAGCRRSKAQTFRP